MFNVDIPLDNANHAMKTLLVKIMLKPHENSKGEDHQECAKIPTPKGETSREREGGGVHTKRMLSTTIHLRRASSYLMNTDNTFISTHLTNIYFTYITIPNFKF